MAPRLPHAARTSSEALPIRPACSSAGSLPIGGMKPDIRSLFLYTYVCPSYIVLLLCAVLMLNVRKLFYRSGGWPGVPKNTTDALVASYNLHDDQNTTHENDPNTVISTH